MAKKEHIVKHSAEELKELTGRGSSSSDWAKSAGMTQSDIEEAVASDPDERNMTMDWDNATVELPQPKAVLNMRIDKDILDYFRKTGKGYQTLINSVLRSYVKQKSRRSDD